MINFTQTGLPSTALSTAPDSRAMMKGLWITKSECLGLKIKLLPKDVFQPTLKVYWRKRLLSTVLLIW